MNLTPPSISAIVSALLRDRKYLADEHAFWAVRARADPSLARFVAQIESNLQVNASALHEVAASVAPWLKQHPEYIAIITTQEPA